MPAKDAAAEQCRAREPAATETLGARYGANILCGVADRTPPAPLLKVG